MQGAERSDPKRVCVANRVVTAHLILRRRRANVPGWCSKPCELYLKNKKTLFKDSVLVGASGLEPPTPTLSGWCSNLLSYAPIFAKLLGLSRHPEYQCDALNLMSYAPIIHLVMVEMSGIVPLTPCLQGRCSPS